MRGEAANFRANTTKRVMAITYTTKMTSALAPRKTPHVKNGAKSGPNSPPLA